MLIGFTLLVLFVMADVLEVENLNAWYLLFGVLFAAFGIYLFILGRKPPEDSGRFRAVRKLTSRSKKKKDDDEGDKDGDE